MSSTRSLTRGYGSFFLGCADLAVLPYTGTFMAIASGRDGDRLNLTCTGASMAMAIASGRLDRTNVAAAAIVCGILTFVVPVLPMIAKFTFAMASIAMSLAIASMFITYPIALLSDLCSSSEDQDHRFAFN